MMWSRASVPGAGTSCSCPDATSITRSTVFPESCPVYAMNFPAGSHLALRIRGPVTIARAAVPSRSATHSVPVSWPALRRGQPASFLLVSPADESRVNLDEARLESVWIDGVEVRGAP